MAALVKVLLNSPMVYLIKPQPVGGEPCSWLYNLLYNRGQGLELGNIENKSS